MTSTESRTRFVRRLEPQLARSRIEVDHGTAYEALLGLIIFAGHEPPGEYAVGSTWFDEVHTRASARLREDVANLCGGVPTVFGHLLGLARQAQQPRDLGALLDLVKNVPPPRLRLELLGCSISSVRAGLPPSVLERAAAGDPAATTELLNAAEDDSRWASSLRTVLAMTPQQVHDLTVRVLDGWGEEVFAVQESHLAPRLAAQAQRWLAAADRTTWREVVEEATGGIILDEDLPADRVLLVPTVLGAPWVYSTEVTGTKIFCCPVRDPAAIAAPQLVPVLRALGDETRLKILHHLAVNGSATLAQLTAELGISKSAVHKHVMLLRSVGVIRVHLGRDRRYTLRELPDLNDLLSQLINAGP